MLVHPIDKLLHHARMLAGVDTSELLTGVGEGLHRHSLECVVGWDVLEDFGGWKWGQEGGTGRKGRI